MKSARGGTEHKEEIREKTIRVRRKTYERLKSRGDMGDDFDDVISRALDRLEELDKTKGKWADLVIKNSPPVYTRGVLAMKKLRASEICIGADKF